MDDKALAIRHRGYRIWTASWPSQSSIILSDRTLQYQHFSLFGRSLKLTAVIVPQFTGWESQKVPRESQFLKFRLHQRGAVMSSSKNSTIIEDLFWQYANRYLGEENVKKLTDEQNRPYLKYGGMALLAVYLVFGHLAQLISNIVGFVYPAYCSVKALETSCKADDTKWLTYWVVFASFSLLDTFSGFLLSWIPFYWLAKVLFLVWCFAPSEFNGSTVIYNKVILPLFKKHEKKIDSAMGRVDKAVTSASKEAQKITETIRTDI